MKRTIAVTLALVALISACALPTGGRPTTTPPPGAPMLTVTSEGGFVPVEYLVGRGPRYVLLADGRLIFEGPVPTIYPGPMLAPSLVVRIDDATMGRIRRLVDEIGFPGFSELRNDDAADRVADATTEVVTYRDATGPHVFAVYALGLVEPNDRRVELLTELLEVLDEAAAAGDAEPFPVDRLLVHVAEGAADPEFPDVRPWPLPQRPAEVGPVEPSGWACTVYEGPTAAELVDVFSAATQVTVWEEAGSTYRILARALLPGEAGCTLSG